MIAERVRQIVAEHYDIAISDFTDDTDFYTDFGSSLDTVAMLMECEEEFGITISDEDASEIRTTGNLISYVRSHVTPEPKVWPPPST